MPALLDTLDRFNYASSSIRSLTQSQRASTEPGPFTAAILQLSPHDLLRDADEAEYGLFTFVRDSPDLPLDGLVAAQGAVGRREFRGATPLRRKRAASGTVDDEEPEVYIEAALKYLDRFNIVKPMPHMRTEIESLIERLNNVRDNIERLQASVDENSRASPKSQVAEEERRISELKSRILQLQKRKEALTSKLPSTSKTQLRGKNPPRPMKGPTKNVPPRTSLDSTSSAVSTPDSQTKMKGKGKPPPPTRGSAPVPGPSTRKRISPETPKHRISSGADEAERSFWSGNKSLKFGPGDSNRSNSLLDEKLDMSAFDALMSPTPSTPGSSHPLKLLDDSTARQDVDLVDDLQPTDDHPEDESSDSGDPTIVVSKLVPPQTKHTPETELPSHPPRPPSQAARSEPQTPVQDNKTATPQPSIKTKVKRVRVTAEMERICAKIWSTIPDLLVPGNSFQTLGKKSPNGKDTLAVLQTISAQPLPGPSSDPISSPSTRSTLSSLLGIETLGPASGSPHQIMTAYLLLSLLTAPNHAIPLTALKALLASKAELPSPGPEVGREAKRNAAALAASAGQIATRALYGCVAKKLVKIDRGGGEQVVKFDLVT